MSENSAIEWTDTTWNPVRGCTKVSPGCANCYAETFAERWRGVPGHAYEQGFDLRLVPEKLNEPLRWKKPRRVFVNSMSDLFQDGVPDAFIDRVFAVMALAPQHTFQVLTKRAERMRAYCQKFASDYELEGPDGERLVGQSPLSNVWLGVSVENQHFADERIPLLLQTSAAVRFISAEPLLDWTDLEPMRCDNCGSFDVHQEGDSQPWCVECDQEMGMVGWLTDQGSLDWVIVGGESGHGSRPFDIAWARSIVKQCKAAGVACFVKQLGARAESDSMADLNGHLARGPRWLVLKGKGGDMAEWPEDLRVREFPTSRS